MNIFERIWEIIKLIFGDSHKPEVNENLKLDGIVRGVSLLHLMQPQARSQINTLAQFLVDTQLTQPAFSVLVDGTFGIDINFLATTIRRFKDSRQQPHVVFYIFNGPSQRDFAKTQINAPFVKTAPPEFNRLILVGDQGVKNEVKRLVGNIKSTIALINSMGGNVLICPQLEDNLNDEAFNALTAMIREELHNYSYEIVRNPCSGGNQIPYSVRREEHIHTPANIHLIPNGGVVSNDGKDYWFSNQSGTDYKGRGYPLEQWQTLKHHSSAQNAWFVLWSARYQGYGKQALAPDKRNYPVPTQFELEELKAFLLS